ncbi:MAG TPA: tRNA (cytidine(34)-2'-O)-methyltransferase [Rhabdochlamydiaceae bacterium]|nr:tRNA (cytidine(34)-2'-O)-methyltransferase [Rhabdochlamydiaceae bacterium]
MKIVLFRPQIPQNTGNIVRLCANTGTELYLAERLGFSVTDRQLKRAGLDHWEGVPVFFLEDLMQFLLEREENFYFFSSKATPLYTDIHYTGSDFLIFGSETFGMTEEFHTRWPEKFFTIPQREKSRCLNLANAVSIVLYESLRQQQFAQL